MAFYWMEVVWINALPNTPSNSGLILTSTKIESALLNVPKDLQNQIQSVWSVLTINVQPVWVSQNVRNATIIFIYSLDSA